mgnify:CR=1 FL=1
MCEKWQKLQDKEVHIWILDCPAAHSQPELFGEVLQYVCYSLQPLVYRAKMHLVEKVIEHRYVFQSIQTGRLRHTSAKSKQPAAGVCIKLWPDLPENTQKPSSPDKKSGA